MKKLKVRVRVPIPMNDDQAPIKGVEDTEEEQFFRNMEGFLHHWGIDSETIFNNDNIPVGVVSFTVAVVEDIKTGQIHTFHPTLIKILDYETYEREYLQD